MAQIVLRNSVNTTNLSQSLFVLMFALSGVAIADQKSDATAKSPDCSIFPSTEISKLNDIFSGIRRCDGTKCKPPSNYFNSAGHPYPNSMVDVILDAMSYERMRHLVARMPGSSFEEYRRGAFFDRVVQCVPEAKMASEDAKALASKPDEKLRQAYMDYMGMQACFESRKNYAVKYVTSADMDIARNATKQTEQTLVKANPGLSGRTQALWASAEKEFVATSQIAMGARIAGEKHNSLMAEQCSVLRLAFRLQSGSEKRKKDF